MTKTVDNLMRNLIFPCLALVVVMLLDCFCFPQVVATPLYTLLCLLLLSFVYSTRVLAAWVVIFMVTVGWVLFSGSFGDVENQSTAVMRLVNFCLIGSVVIYLGYQRVRLQQSHQQLLLLLDNLPWPVVVSDKEGNIIFVNQKMAQTMGGSKEAALGTSFFNWFAGNGGRDAVVRQYFEGISMAAGRSMTIQLTLAGQLVEAELSSLQSQTGRLLVSSFERAKSVAQAESR